MKVAICGALVPVIVSVVSTVKLTNIQILKFAHATNAMRKILNRTDTSLNDKKATYKK